MDSSDLLPIIEASSAFENLARRVVMNHRHTLTKSQMDVLVGLKFVGTMNMTEMSRHLAVSKEQATRAVAPLVAKGYVARSRNAENFRAVDISLTEEGARFLEDDLEDILSELMANLETLDDDDVKKLIEASKLAMEVFGKLRASAPRHFTAGGADL